MEFYEKLKLEVVNFIEEDIIRTSPQGEEATQSDPFG